MKYLLLALCFLFTTEIIAQYDNPIATRHSNMDESKILHSIMIGTNKAPVLVVLRGGIDDHRSLLASNTTLDLYTNAKLGMLPSNHTGDPVEHREYAAYSQVIDHTTGLQVLFYTPSVFKKHYGQEHPDIYYDKNLEATKKYNNL